MTDFHNKTILITGAASGIGYLLAKHLSTKAKYLILLDINHEALAKIKTELETKQNTIAIYSCDLASLSHIKTIADEVLSHFKKIDILINNAGIVIGQHFIKTELEQITKTFAVNALAPIYLTRLFLPHMLEANSGHIVNIASAAGLIGSAKMVDYSASKFAAVGFDDALRAELKHLNKNIKTTVVCPYYISTGMFAGVKTRFAWLLPILTPEYVSNKIVDAIEKNKSRVIMPRFIYTVFVARLLPVSCFDWIAKLLGINNCMDEFVGRKHKK